MDLSTKNYRWLAAAGATAGVVAIGATLVVTLTGGPGEAPQYDVSDCKPSPPKVDGKTWGGDITAVSASGDYILGDGESMLWGPDGETASIPGAVKKGIGGLRAVQALDVNSQGTVVGQAYTKGDNDLIGWKYTDGKVSELKAPAKYRDDGVAMQAINDDGDIVGKSAAGSTEGGFLFKWDSHATDAQALEADKDAMIGATVEVTDDGSAIAVAYVGNSDDEMRLWKWDSNGDREKLPYPREVHPTIDFQLAGDWMMIEGLSNEMYRWNMAEARKPEETKLDVSATIDSRGRVFGRNDKDVPAVQTESGIDELPVPDGADAKEYASNTVGAHSGVIGGNGETKDGGTAMVWRCDS